MRQVELSHFDEEGHYAPLLSQEDVRLEHLFLSGGTLGSFEVCPPEDVNLDVEVSLSSGASARWSGIYLTGPVELGWSYRRGDRLVVRCRNVSLLQVFVRTILRVSS